MSYPQNPLSHEALTIGDIEKDMPIVLVALGQVAVNGVVSEVPAYNDGEGWTQMTVLTDKKEEHAEVYSSGLLCDPRGGWTLGAAVFAPDSAEKFEQDTQEIISLYEQVAANRADDRFESPEFASLVGFGVHAVETGVVQVGRSLANRADALSVAETTLAVARNYPEHYDLDKLTERIAAAYEDAYPKPVYGQLG